MRKTILLSFNELTEILENAFDCCVNFITVEENFDGEIIDTLVVEIYHNNKQLIDLAFPSCQHRGEHLAVVEFSELYETLSDLLGEELSGQYDFVTVCQNYEEEECIVFDLL